MVNIHIHRHMYIIMYLVWTTQSRYKSQTVFLYHHKFIQSFNFKNTPKKWNKVMK